MCRARKKEETIINRHAFNLLRQKNKAFLQQPNKYLTSKHVALGIFYFLFVFLCLRVGNGK